MGCLFCSAEGKLSREHLWPVWAVGTYDQGLGPSVSHSLHEGGGPAHRQWGAPVFSATLKRVCARCNNGWMSKLEARARPHAAPLLKGETRVLGREAQRAIALWAYLKALLFIQVGDDDMKEAMAPAYKTFFDIQGEDLLPLHTSIFVAHHIGPREGQYQHRLLGEGPDAPRLFVQTLTMRRLTVQVVKNYVIRAPVEPERHPAVANVGHRIWPVGPSFTWPPGPGLDDHGLTLYTGPQPGTRFS